MEKKANRRRSVGMKTFVVMLALVLVIGCAVGGTVAWLVSSTSAVVNTFTYGDINITLGETTGNDYKIIPGVNIDKNPKVTVKKDSEACWLFVKVVKDGTFVDGKVSYSVDTDKWTLVPGQNNVYYRAVTEAEAKAGVSYYVLKGDATYTDGVITVSNTLTKEDIKNITTKPTLTFTAYAVQQAGFDTAEAAWAEAAKLG